ncbi:MAG: mechanosensitive ion channel [Xanthomonadales bacterium]|nr:mechanosensitive ion channel [Xanthomonadales bacterium]
MVPKYNSYKLIGLIFLLLQLVEVKAQADLNLFASNSKETKEYELPEISQLPTDWWIQAIKTAPPDQPFLHLSSWGNTLLSQAQSEGSSLTAESLQAIRQFNINISNLTQNSEIKETEAPLSLTQQESYALNEVLEVMQQLRQKNQQLENERATLAVFQNDVTKERQKIDRLIISYQQYSVDQKEKNTTAYQWLEARSWLAIYEIQITQFTSKIEQTQFQINSLQQHLSDIKEKLQPNIEDLDKLDKQIDINRKALAKAQQDALNSSSNLTNNKDSVGTGAVDFEKLNLAQSLIAQKRLELAIARDELHKHWIVNKLDTEVTLEQPTEELVTSVNQLLQDARDKVTQWRTLAQEVLLSSVGVNNTTSEMARERTLFSQEVLLKLDGLDWQIERVSFIQSLTGNNLNQPESGMTGFFHGIANFTSTVTSGFSAVVNKPLFRINESPVTLLPLLRLIIIVLVGYLVSKLVRYIIKRMESRRSNDKSPVFFMLDKLIHYIIIFVAALAGFTTLGIDFSNLTLIAGALSVGIGFGLQNIVSNFVSGLTIMFERTLKVGDYIEIENGFTGTVKEINARSTRINTNDNIDVVIPNSDLVTNQIINWTLRDSIKRVKIPFGVAYGTDKDLVKKAAQEAAENVPYTLTNMSGKEPEVWMTGFGDNSLDFILLVWVSKYGVRRPNRIKAAYLWELDTAFNKYGIEIPFPQRVLHHAKDSTDLDDELGKVE